MKNILLLLGLIFLPALTFTQNKPPNKFYRHQKRGTDVQNMRVPVCPIRTGGKIARKQAEKEEDKMAMDLLNDFGPVRFMYWEDGSEIPQEDIQKLREDLFRNDFEDLIMIRDGEMNLQIMVQEEGSIIRNLFMLYHDSEDGEMVFISAKANMNLEDLGKLINKAMEEKLEPIFEQEKEEPVAVEPVL